MPQREWGQDFDKRCLVAALDATAHALEVSNLIYGAESGRLWKEHAEYFNSKERVDEVLLGNLNESHLELCKANLSTDAAQALLIQAMFIAYLEDREIITSDYFEDATRQKAGSFSALLETRDVKLLKTLFATLRDDFNGDLFVAPCSFESAVKAPTVTEAHLGVLARFRSGREEMAKGGQFRFWGYDFRYIPIELVSAVYDRFLGEREDERKAQGAYYTPMFLADSVVSQLAVKRVRMSSLVRGDIILTTTTAVVSKAIRWGTKSDISHAIICVQHGSVIDATSEGVHARNPQRLFFDDKCALHVLRVKAALSADQIDQICRFVRERIGSEYSTREAVRAAIGGSDQWTRKQFCSRLVAQAYTSAGIKLVGDPNYCSPADLVKSSLLASVPDAVDQVSDEEVDRWAAHSDSTEAMRRAINTVLKGARTKDKNIQTFEDIGPYLIQNPADDAFFSDLLDRSGYLTLWQLNTERNRWQYEDALLAELPPDECEEYCKGMVKDEEAGPHRYLTNRAAYRGLFHQHSLTFFKLLFELFDLLAAEHRQRQMVARRWLEAKEMIAPAADVILRPHSPEWFVSMDGWDPVKAAVTRFVIEQEGRDDVCSVCGDDPAVDYRLEKAFRPPGGPDTLRLCDDCLEIRRSMGNPFEAM
jgi:hypothetical protein